MNHSDAGQIRELDVTLIRTDGGTQMRASMSDDAVENYAEALALGDVLPPPVVFCDGEDYWLADGFHTLAAHKKNRVTTVACRVVQGSLRDAILFATGRNSAHGLPRTRADKRNAVMSMLLDHEWSQWSPQKIANTANVSDEFVRKVRKELGLDGGTSRGVDGKQYPAHKRQVPTLAPGRDENDGAGDVASDQAQPAPAAAASSPDDAEGYIPPVEDAPLPPAGRPALRLHQAREDIRDRTGAVVPDHLRDVFADPALKDALAEMDGWVNAGRPAHWKSLMKRLSVHYAYIRAGDFFKQCDVAMDALDLMVSAARDGLPHAVCPTCKGRGADCADCRGSGHVNVARWRELRGEVA